MGIRFRNQRATKNKIIGKNVSIVKEPSLPSLPNEADIFFNRAYRGYSHETLDNTPQTERLLYNQITGEISGNTLDHVMLKNHHIPVEFSVGNTSSVLKLSANDTRTTVLNNSFLGFVGIFNGGDPEFGTIISELFGVVNPHEYMIFSVKSTGNNDYMGIIPKTERAIAVLEYTEDGVDIITNAQTLDFTTQTVSPTREVVRTNSYSGNNDFMYVSAATESRESVDIMTTIDIRSTVPVPSEFVPLLTTPRVHNGGFAPIS